MFRKNWDYHANKLTELRNQCQQYPRIDPKHEKLLNSWDKEIESARDYIKIEASKGKADSNQTQARFDFLNAEIRSWNAERQLREDRIRDLRSSKMLGNIISHVAGRR